LLFSPDGELLDKLLLPDAGPDISYGRTDGKLLYYASSTPGTKNGDGALGGNRYALLFHAARRIRRGRRVALRR
jgi:hypothetical protein